MNKLLLTFFLLPFSIHASSNWNGQYYANHSEMQYKMAMRTLESAQIDNNAKVLDIGCGDGRITNFILTLAPQGYVIGIDKSASMIAKAHQYANHRLTFVMADVIDLSFDSQFDNVVSFNCLHWVVDIQKALKNVHRALVPGGKACILVVPIQARYPLHHIIDSVAKNPDWKSYFDDSPSIFKLYTFAQWTSLVESSGLIPEHVQIVDGSLDYPNKDAFGKWLAGWIPFGTIPDSMKQQFVTDIVNAYTKVIVPENDGTIHFFLDEIMIIASKKEISITQEIGE